MFSSTIAHWVLIVGKKNNQYIINDPLGKKNGYEYLSKYDSEIYAIRYLEKK